MCRAEIIKSCKCTQCSCEGQSIIYNCPLLAQSKANEGKGKCPIRRTYTFDADDNIVCHICENGVHGQYGSINPETREHIENWQTPPTVVPWDGVQDFTHVVNAYPVRRLAPGTPDCPMVAPSGPVEVIYHGKKEDPAIFNPSGIHLSEAGRRKGQVAAEALPNGMKFGEPQGRAPRPSVAGTGFVRERTESFVTGFRGVRLQTPQQSPQQPIQQRRYTQQQSPVQQRQYPQQPTPTQIQQFLQNRAAKYQQFQQQPVQQQQYVQRQLPTQYPQQGFQQPQFILPAQAPQAQFAYPTPVQQRQFAHPPPVQWPRFFQPPQVQQPQFAQPPRFQQHRASRPQFPQAAVSPLHVQISREDSEPVEKFPEFREEDFDPNDTGFWDFDDDFVPPTAGDASVDFEEPAEKYFRSNDPSTDEGIIESNQRDLDELFGGAAKSVLGEDKRNATTRSPQAPERRRSLPKQQSVTPKNAVDEASDTELSDLSSHDSEMGDTITVPAPKRVETPRRRGRPSQRGALCAHKSDGPTKKQAPPKRHYYTQKAPRPSTPQRPAKPSESSSESGSESASSEESEEDVPRRGGRRGTRKNAIKKSVGKRELTALRRDSGGKRELDALRRGSKHARSPGPNSPSSDPNKRSSTRVQAQERPKVVEEETEDEDEEMPDAGLHLSSDEDSDTADEYKPAKKQENKRRRY